MIKVIMKIGALAVVVPVALLAVYVLVPYFWFWTPADTVCPADGFGSAPVAETAAIAQELEQFRAEQGALGLQAACHAGRHHAAIRARDSIEGR